MSNFKITHHKGLQMTFENGWTVSIQFGPGNYCDKHCMMDYAAPKKQNIWESSNAEIAAWDRNGTWYKFENEDVKGYCNTNEVANFIQIISTKE